MRRWRAARSFLGLLAATGMRFGGRLAPAQSRSHRSCQRNRGNFCLINDIGFDIFPRPLAAAASVALRRARGRASERASERGPSSTSGTKNSFSRVRVPTSFTIIVAENLAGGNLRLRARRASKRRSSSVEQHRRRRCSLL